MSDKKKEQIQFSSPDLVIPDEPIPCVVPPERSHTIDTSPADDRGSLPWLLSKSEEEERAKLLEWNSISNGALSLREESRLRLLMSKKKLDELADENQAKIHYGGAFLPK